MIGTRYRDEKERRAVKRAVPAFPRAIIARAVDASTGQGCVVLVKLATV